MRARSPSLNAYQRDTVRAWWVALQPQEYGESKPSGAQRRFDFNRGDRARLARAVTVEDLMLTRATHALWRALYPDADEAGERPHRVGMDVFERVAVTAGVLAHVRDDAKDGRTLAWRLGAACDTAKGRAAMNDIRFQRLIKASTFDELHTLLVRAVKLAAAKADVVQLADDVLTWLAQTRLARVDPSRSVKLYWAHDYYLNPKEQAGIAAEPVKELIA